MLRQPAIHSSYLLTHVIDGGKSASVKQQMQEENPNTKKVSGVQLHSELVMRKYKMCLNE